MDGTSAAATERVALLRKKQRADEVFLMAWRN